MTSRDERAVCDQCGADDVEGQDMARPTLDRNVKFKTLVKRLRLPRPYVRGLLETMWDVANECGNPILGTAEDVECAAEWPGKRGVFFEAVKGAFIDELEGGRWQIHDYWDHAPKYVKNRRYMEDRRKATKPGNSDQIDGGSRPENDCKGDSSIDKGLGADCGPQSPTSGQKSLTPAPAPAPTNTPIAPKGAEGVGGEPPGFVRWWDAWPRHHRKKGRAKCLRDWRRFKLEAKADAILAALEWSKASPDWTKQGGAFIPGPHPWLGDTPWETNLGELTSAPAERPDWMAEERDATEEEIQAMRLELEREDAA
jgi:hypothetical protein